MLTTLSTSTFNFSDTSFFPLGMSLLLLSVQGDTMLGSFWPDFSLTVLTVDVLPSSIACLFSCSLYPVQLLCANHPPPHPSPARCQSSLAEECRFLLIQFPKWFVWTHSCTGAKVLQCHTCAGTANLSWGRGSLKSELLRIFSQDRCTETPMSILWSVPAPALKGNHWFRSFKDINSSLL